MSVKLPTANDMYHTAQDLIRAGQPVFPCHMGPGPRAKAPMTKNGFLDATLDITKVKRWMQRHGAVALGIPTGIKYDILDVDVKHDADGRKYMDSLTSLGLLNGCKQVVRTPSGGFHLYFNALPGAVRNKAEAGLGLDVRGSGGYVIAAGSYVDDEESTVGYYTDEGGTEGSTNEPLLWDLILSSISPRGENNKPVMLLPSERQASIGALREWLAETPIKGERNNCLHWAVCRCIENNIDPHELVEAATLTGLGEEEILKTVDAAMVRAGLREEDMDTEAEAMFPDE